MRIVIVTDAWLPQTNGVVSTLRQTTACLEQQGHEVLLVTPDLFRSIPCPTYPEIRLSLFPFRKLARLISEFCPDAIHIATEGSLGFAARRYCVGRRLNFTTSYHTQFPQYLRARYPIPTSLSYRALLWFHGAATHCMVSTQTVHNQLAERGFRNLARWQRGVDTNLFKPGAKDFLQLPRPIAAYVGRVAIEKNIDAFLRMPWAGTKLVIGDGPELPRLRAQYPDAVYAGYRFGEDLTRHLAASDVFVFPSLTDTFGLVNLEAMACGVPVAAFPVTGPIDVVEDGVTGALDEDLARAALRALAIDPQKCRDRALRSGWERCSREFEANLVPCLAQREKRAMFIAPTARSLRQPI
ncbi:MAG: glycosyltransferase family 1 protein [Steroidobacteraceae bacterium]|nr:glycosyltransferase family 1 protein [Steroidobacteraceae bacterium]